MDLNDVRKDIDRIDSQIKPLFVERMGCAKRVAEVKAQTHGDVFVLERELAIIEKSVAGVDASIKDEYVGFLRNLFSVSRHFQYGMLKDMQDTVINGALEKAGLKAESAYSAVEITFTCFTGPSNLNILCNTVILSNVEIDNMSVKTVEGKHQVDMVLKGSLQDNNFRRVLTQLAKESNNFAIKALL